MITAKQAPSNNLINLSDERLLQLIAGRDADALAELYDRYAQTLYSLIARIVRDQIAADKVHQETFWQVWQKPNTFAGQGSVGARLYRLARTTGLNWLRAEALTPRPPLPILGEGESRSDGGEGQ